MHAVTCRTEGCVNEGFTLILSNPGHTIVCGPCGQTIGDVEPASRPEVPEVEPVPEDPEPEVPEEPVDEPDPEPEEPEEPEDQDPSK